MADEEKNEETENEAAEAPEAEGTPEAEADTEAAPEETPEPKQAAPKAPAPKADSGGDEDSAPTGPKLIRKRARSTHSGESAEPRSGEDRAAARVEARKAKAAQRSRYRATQRAKKSEQRTGTPVAEREPGTQKLRQGIVTSAKADKTITVQIESATRHPAYEKIVRRSKSLHAHDENNEAGPGDTVRVIETRPMSKSKRWRLVEVVDRAE